MTGPESGKVAANASFNLALACLAIALVLLPLSFAKPGVPAQLAPKEAATYLAALSIAHDHDFICSDRDLARLFREYPFAAATIPVQSSDGWSSARFAVPPIYPLLLAPLTVAFGGNGPLALNMALLAAMIAIAARRLRAENPDSVALLFAVGFFAMTPLFVYALMVQNEIFAAALGFFALALTASEHDRRETDLPRAGVAALVSAVLLAVAVSEQPLLVLLFLPILHLRLAKPRNRVAALWIVAFAATLAVVVGFNYFMSGSVAHWLARASGAAIVDGPRVTLPPEPAAAPTDFAGAAPASPTHPRLDLSPRRIALDSAYALVGRHSGIVFYAPFALFAGILGARARRRGFWTTTTAIVGAVLLCILLLPGAWQGGGQAVGNRYFLALYPGLVLMVGRIAPVAPLAAAWALGGLSLGPLLFTTLGPAVPWPDRQTHARHRLLRQLPLERTLLDQLDGYGVVFSGAQARWLARRDTVVRDGDKILVHGALGVELWLEGGDVISDIDVELTSLAADNRVVVDDGSEAQEFAFPAGADAETRPAPVPATIRPGDCTRLEASGGERHVCRIEIHARTGDWPKWRGQSESRFLVGVEIDIVSDSEIAASNPIEAR